MRVKPLEELKAKNLFVNQFYTAKAAAKAVGVTEKTIGKWIKKNNWKQAQAETAEKHVKNSNTVLITPKLILNDLMAYIELESPKKAIEITPLINNYLKTIS